MTEFLSQILTLIVLLCMFGGVVRELALYRRMSPTLREWPVALKAGVPRVTDVARLEGLAGERDGVVWRWDAEQRVLRFRRRFFQREGHLALGSVRFDTDGTPRLALRPVPISVWAGVTAFGAWGVIGLAVNEGPLLAVLGVPLVPVLFAPFVLLQVAISRRVLNRDLLPVIAAEIRGRVGPA